MAKSENSNVLTHDLKLIEKYSNQFLENRESNVFENKEGEYIYSINEQEPTFKQKLMLHNTWTSIIDWSVNLGNNHFAVTISNTNIIVNDLDKKNEIIDKFLWETCYSISKNIKENFKTLTWLFFVCELTKNKEIHFHAIIAIKNFIDFNHCIRNNLSIILPIITASLFHKILDIKISSLNYFNDIRNWINYMHKDIDKWNYQGRIFVTNLYRKEFEILNCIYENILIIPTFDERGNKIDKNDFVDGNFECNAVEIWTLDYEKINLLIKNRNERFNDYMQKLTAIDTFTGTKLINNKINNNILIKLLKYYLVFNEYYIDAYNIYVKIKETMISYKYVEGLKTHMYNNFLKNVKIFYINNFSNYFNGFDFDNLCDMFLIKTKNTIESLEVLSENIIKPTFSILEFNDGLYFIKYDKFLEKKNLNINILKNLTTTKYYNKSFEWVRQVKPTTWINSLKHSIGIDGIDGKKNEHYENIIFFFFKILNEVFDKKNTLYIFGKSGTGKSLLIANTLYNIFGKQQIGSVVGEGGFQFQDLEGKSIALLEEWKYSSKNSPEFLKITSGEDLLISKKYSKEHIIIKRLFSVILTNHEFKEKKEIIKEAFNNRMYYSEFENRLRDEDLKDFSNFKKKLDDEEVNIILFCNKYFFKKKKGLINKRMLKKNFIKLIIFDFLLINFKLSSVYF